MKLPKIPLPKRPPEHHMTLTQRFFHDGHFVAHGVYLGATYIEGHGIHALAAIAVLVLTLGAAWLGHGALE